MTNINFNTNPYFDDYDQSKNYLKVLFRPGFAVQARELTQLQTALQAQITRFGNHMFKEGSIVLGGESYDTTLNWIIVDSGEAAALLDTTFTGQSSGAKAQTFLIEQIDDDTTRVYFVYTNGYYFTQNETILTEDNYSFDIIDEEAFWGEARGYSIVESVFFVKGYFVYCEAQKIILYNNNQYLNVRVGLKIEEKIVTYNDDQTLLDPAYGSYNYAAPGADRYAITLQLVGYEFDPQEELTVDTENFVELARYVKNNLVYKISNSTYSEIENTLARRTYDESGDYTVRAFKIKPVEYYGTNDENPEDYFSLAVEPGKAYVKGYEFETIATTYVDIEKSRDYVEKSGRQFQSDFGRYFVTATPVGSNASGYLDYNACPEIILKSGGYGGTAIGTANVRGVEKVDNNLFRIYVFNEKITNDAYKIRDVDALGSTTGWRASGYSGASGLTLLNRRPHIIQLPDANIRTLLTDGVPDTSYTTFDTFETTTDGAGVAVINTRSSNDAFLGTLKSDFYTTDATSGYEYNCSGVTVTSPTSRTLSFGAAAGNKQVKVFTKIGRSNVLQKKKTLSTGTVSGVAIGTKSRISLNQYDCYKLVSVIAKDTDISPVEDLDVTAYFTFNNGQKDTYYGHGWVKVQQGITFDAAYDELEITFKYFAHSSSTGFFSVDSYPWSETPDEDEGTIAYADIPSYNSDDGTIYNLKDCLDFRPRLEVGGTTMRGAGTVIPNTTIVADYSYFLSRIDKLVLTKERNFKLIQGVPAETPTMPEDSPDAMTLYVLNIPAYTNVPSDITYSYVDNRRYTMRDIGKIEKRVERLEYYTSLSMLEKQAKDEELLDPLGVERFKNGILVDSFAGHSVGDVTNNAYRCAIDKKERILRPRHSSYSFEFVPTNRTNTRRDGDLITLPYTQEVLEGASNIQATGTINLNPYSVFKYIGTMTLDPATDTWTDVHTRPDVTINMNGENDVYTTIVPSVDNPASVGVTWNDWIIHNRGTTITDKYTTNVSSGTMAQGNTLVGYTTTSVNNAQTTTVHEELSRTGIEISRSQTQTVTRDMGTRVVDTSIVPYIRSKVIHFAATGMKPDTYLHAFFDGTEVTEFCSMAQQLVFPEPPTDTLAPYKDATTGVVVTPAANKVAGNTTNPVNVVNDKGIIIEDKAEATRQEAFRNSHRRIPKFATEVRTADGRKHGRIIHHNPRHHHTHKVYVKPSSKMYTDDEIALGTAPGGHLAATEKPTGDNVVVDKYAFVAGDTVQFRVVDPDTGTDTWVDALQPLQTLVSPGILKTDEDGNVAGYFHIPNTDEVRFRTGERAFKLVDTVDIKNVKTAAETKYVAQGLAQETERVILATKVASVSINPVDEHTTRIVSQTVTNIPVSSNTVTYAAPPPAPAPELQNICDAITDGKGGRGRFTYTIDFGSSVGSCGIDFRTGGVPDRATLIWNGNEYSTGFWGNGRKWNKWLTDHGFPKVAKEVHNQAYYPLRFNKTSAHPRTATLIVDAPCPGTGWAFKQVCPPSSVGSVPYDITITSNTATHFWGQAPNIQVFPLTVTLRNGHSSNHFGYVTLTSNRAGLTVNAPHNVPFYWRNGVPFTIYVTLNRANAGLGPNDSFTGYINARAVEVTEAGGVATGSVTPVATGTITQTLNPVPRRRDPVAQTFFVNAEDYPNGIFVTGASVWFRTKSLNQEVTMQIRPTVNGYPSANTVLPYAVANIRPDQINISENATLPTRISFQNIIHLSPGEYALVLITDTTDYEVFTSKLGEFDIRTGQRVTQQPTLGSLFKSQNGTTWTASQEEDLMYRLHRAVFDTTMESVVEYQVNPAGLKGDIEYDMFYAMGESVAFPETKTKYHFKMTGDSSWTRYQLGKNTPLLERKTLLHETPSSLQFKTTMSTTNRDITPVLDTNRLSCVLVKNVIDSYTNVNVTIEADDDLVTYVDHPFVNGEMIFFSAVEPTTNFAVNTPYYVVYVDENTFKLASTLDLTPINVTADAAATIDMSGEQDPYEGYADARYITRKVKLNPGFESRDLSVRFLANIPSSCTVDAYYRVSSITDTAFEDNQYIKMELDYSGAYTETGWIEYKYKTPWDTALESGEQFDTFAVKLVMYSTNTVQVPQIRDLRVIAIDE